MRKPEARNEQTVMCRMCGESFTEDDLRELRGFNEPYWCDGEMFICPDCWDSFRRMDLEEQMKTAISNEWKEVDHGTKHAD